MIINNYKDQKCVLLNLILEVIFHNVSYRHHELKKKNGIQSSKVWRFRIQSNPNCVGQPHLYIKLQGTNDTELTNSRCCLYQIASVWICRIFGRNIVYIVSWSTYYIYRISCDIRWKVPKNTKLWRDRRVLIWEFYIMESMNTLQLQEVSVIRIQKLESSLALKFKDCARFYVRRWQCQAQRRGNSAEGFEEGRLAAVGY